MKTAFAAVVTALVLGGCASQSDLPEVTAIKNPERPGAKVPPTHYHPAITGYEHREPVSPDGWTREQPDGAQQ